MNNTDATVAPHGDRPARGLVFSLVLSTVIAIGGFCYLALLDRHPAGVPNRVLRQSCEANWGVLVEGVSETNGSTTQFSLCIPERAFECADLE